MLSFQVAILLVVFNSVICARLPIPQPAADVVDNGNELDVGARDTERQRSEALKQKLSLWRESLGKDENDAKTLRDINKKNTEKANEEIPILSSDFEGGRARAFGNGNWEDMKEKKVETHAGNRQNREALVREPIDRNVLKRRWSKNGKMRVRLTDHNGVPLFRNRRFDPIEKFI